MSGAGPEFRLPVDRATLHASAHRDFFSVNGVSMGPVLAELDVPDSGAGWVRSELHEGLAAPRAIVLWSNGSAVWASGDRTVGPGDWVGVELPLTIEPTSNA